MRPHVVVDVGNSRIKFGRCQGGRVLEHVSLADDPDEWTVTVRRWYGVEQLRIVAAGVHPDRLRRLRQWAGPLGHDEFAEIIGYWELPLPMAVDEPSQVGIDRLLGVLAASRRVEPGQPAVVVAVGSAVTVNMLTPAGAFGGGCILPGPWMMARALHEFTAGLPRVEPDPAAGPVGRTTQTAIQAGIQAALVGAVRQVVANVAVHLGQTVRLFLTGGGHWMLSGIEIAGVVGQPESDERLTLDGIRIAAEALP